MSSSTRFETNCTLPSERHYFVSGPNSRGTLDILWTCLSALIISTWTIQHLNIPAQRPSKTWRQFSWNFVRQGSRKVAWMITMLIAPEIMVGAALMYLTSARNSVKEMVPFAEGDCAEWTLVHGFFANMGGFVIRFTPETPLSTEELKSPYGTDGLDQLQQQPPTTPRGSIEIRSETLELVDSVVSMDSEKQFQPSLSHPPRTVVGLEPRVPSNPYDRWIGHSEEVPAETCPCREEQYDRGWEYMRIEDIASHKLPFYNGRFFVNPGRFNNPLHPSTDVETSSQPNPNSVIASQALLEFTQRPNIGPMDVDDIASCFGSLRSSLWALDAKQLHIARSLGIIDRLPNVTEEEINDQSKGDFLVKSIALTQVSYMAIQLIVRKIQGIPSSQLEVMTVAFASCALLIYTLSFQKPQDVQVPRLLNAARYPTVQELGIIAAAGPYEFLPAWIKGQAPVRDLSYHYCGKWSFDHNKPVLPSAGAPAQIFIIGLILGSTIFGAIHFVAYHFSFPTDAERILWHVSCMLTVALPFSLFLASIGNLRLMASIWGLCLDSTATKLLPVHQSEKIVRWRNRVGSDTLKGLHRFKQSFWAVIPGWIVGIGLLVYAACRMFLLVESFRTLLFLPGEAFKSTEWLDVFPNIG